MRLARLVLPGRNRAEFHNTALSFTTPKHTISRHARYVRRYVVADYWNRNAAPSGFARKSGQLSRPASQSWTRLSHRVLHSRTILPAGIGGFFFRRKR